MDLRIINPVDYRGWDEMLLATRDYSFFHTSHWARVLHESYGYRPLYFSAVDKGSLSFSMPVMEVKSLLTGRRGVSLPFTDYCDPIVTGEVPFEEMMDCLKGYGKRAGWRFIEFRGGRGFPPGLPLSSSCYGHTIDYAPYSAAEQVFSAFRESTKRNIRKALRRGVVVRRDDSPGAMRDFYRLNCLTRKMHGLPPQPWRFFRKIHEHVVSGDHGQVMLASYKDRTIAGAVFFHFGGKALFKYGASDRRYQHLRANNLLMWEGIRGYLDRGFKTFCFGRTEREDSGLRQFKNGWGASEEIIGYYRYDLGEDRFLKGSAPVSALFGNVFNRMPLPLLRVVGSVLYRHAG